MMRFIFWRIVQAPLILVIVYVVTFLLAWCAPGTPFVDSEKNLSPAILKDMKARYHADNSLEFLAYYPWQIIRHHDLGLSMAHEGWSVNDVLAGSLPVSITLGLVALTLATVAGCTIGVFSAVRQGGWFDTAGLFISLVGISIPGFVVAGLLIVVFSDKLHWFPSGGWGNLSRLVLPAVALALMPTAYIAQLTRVSMLDILPLDFIRTAQAKGLRRSQVLWRHAFRNAFLPVFTYLGPAAAGILTGSFVVETIFNIPGLGQHFVNAVKDRDQTLILGTTLVYAAFLISLNLLVDIGYALVDPRIDVAARRDA